MAIRAGRLNRKIEILEATETQDETGYPVKTYAHKAYAWANVIGITGKEKALYGREEVATMMFRLELRYLDDLSAKDKIKFNDYEMDIVSLAPRGRLLRETLEVICEVVEGEKIVNV